MIFCVKRNFFSKKHQFHRETYMACIKNQCYCMTNFEILIKKSKLFIKRTLKNIGVIL